MGWLWEAMREFTDLVRIRMKRIEPSLYPLDFPYWTANVVLIEQPRQLAGVHRVNPVECVSICVDNLLKV